MQPGFEFVLGVSYCRITVAIVTLQQLWFYRRIRFLGGAVSRAFKTLFVSYFGLSVKCLVTGIIQNYILSVIKFVPFGNICTVWTWSRHHVNLKQTQPKQQMHLSKNRVKAFSKIYFKTNAMWKSERVHASHVLIISLIEFYTNQTNSIYQIHFPI